MVILGGNDIKKWRLHNLAYAFTLFFCIFFFADTFESMIQIWIRSETYAHGFLVAPIAAWLVWRKKDFIKKEVPNYNFYFLIPLFLLLILWILGSLTFINSITQFAVVGMIVILTPLVYGWRVCKIVFFPLCFLFFAVPTGEFLLPQLMDWTAAFTIMALRFSGVPVYQEGLRFVISTGSWSVVEACSGIRYLIASLTVGTLFAYINYNSLKKRIIFVGFSIFVPVLANWLRAYMIVMIGHYSGNTLAVGVDHLIYGWVFFGFVITVMFVVGSRWTDAQSTSISKNSIIQLNKNIENKFYYKLIFISLLVSSAFFLASLFNKHAVYNNNVEVSKIMPPIFLADNWRLSDLSIFWSPVLPGVSSYFNKIYEDKNEKVGLYVGYYELEDSNHKLITSTNLIVDEKEKKWILLKSDDVNFDAHKNNFSMKSFLLRQNNIPQEDYLIVRRVYWINGIYISNDYFAKFYSAVSRLFSFGKLDSAVIYVYAHRSANGEASLDRFLIENILQVDIFLNRFKEQRWALPALN